MRDFVHPPLHYYLLHVWFEVTGVGIFQARLLAALFGILSLPLLFAVARRLLDRETAILATLLLALSQFAVLYSQEARPYSQYLFLFLAALWLFLEAIESGRSVIWWSFAGCAALLLYTHYFSAVALAVLVLFAWVYRKRYPVPWSRWASAVCWSLLALRPLYFQPYKEDYRSALAYLNANYRGGDCCISAPRVLPFGKIDS